MRQYLQGTQAKATLYDKASSIFEIWKMRNNTINKVKTEQDTPEKVFELLARRFFTSENRMQVRQAFMSRYKLETEDWLQYLDALERLRRQRYPKESNRTKRY